MLKQLTLSVLAAALLPACILTTDNTTLSDSISETGTTAGTTGSASGTTDGSATDVGTTQGSATDAATGTTTDVPTTDAPTTDGTTTAGTTDQTTATDATTSNTTGMSGFGMCGWSDKNYYACAPDGVPGAEDPMMMAPIACPDGLVEGDKCDIDNGPVTNVGCCTPEGNNYYCDTEDTNTIILEACGA